MRSFVALGITVVTLVLVAGKLTRQHRRAVPPPEPADAEAPLPPSQSRQISPHEARAWSGPTLRELLDQAPTPAVIRGHARGPDGSRISVRASTAGKRDRSRWIRVENGGASSKSYGCISSDDTCELTALPVNLLFNLTAESADCATTNRTIVLHAGDNDLSLPCEPARAAQAPTRDVDGDAVEEEFAVQ